MTAPDRGISLVLTAITMVLLLVFSALAIDVGAVYSERRQDQSAADAAALGAAAVAWGQTDAQLVETVRVSLNQNTGADFTTADLATCAADAGSLPVVPVVGGTTYDCISMNAARTQIRVRVPERQYETVFARVVGLDQFSHSAFAIAQSRARRGPFGGVLPLAITAAASGGHVCLNEPPGGLSTEPCGGSITGNFRYLNFGFHGNVALGTSVSCGNGAQQARISANLAMGVDHDLSVINGPPHFATVVIDTENCFPEAFPNSARTTTGNTPQVVGAGIVSGSAGTFPDGEPARLRRVADFPAGVPEHFNPPANHGGRLLDDTPLWAFIDPSLSNGDDVPAACLPAVFTNGLVNPPSGVSLDAHMLSLLTTCLAAYEAGGHQDPIFGRDDIDPGILADIEFSPRFAYVPVVQNFPPGTSSPVSFIRFRPVFIQRVTIGQGGQSVEFQPGVGVTSNNSDSRAAEVTGLVLPDGSLPFGLSGPDAPFSATVRAVELIR